MHFMFIIVRRCVTSTYLLVYPLLIPSNKVERMNQALVACIHFRDSLKPEGVT